MTGEDEDDFPHFFVRRAETFFISSRTACRVMGLLARSSVTSEAGLFRFLSHIGGGDEKAADEDLRAGGHCLRTWTTNL